MPQWRAPLGSSTDRQPPSDAEAMQKPVSQVIIAPRAQASKALRNTSDARRQAAKRCYRFGPPSARSANLIAGDGTWRNRRGRLRTRRAGNLCGVKRQPGGKHGSAVPLCRPRRFARDDPPSASSTMPAPSSGAGSALPTPTRSPPSCANISSLVSSHRICFPFRSEV
jgi:hypothetical protein